MSVTESIRTGEQTTGSTSPPPRAPRRGWTSRFSIGHGLMIGAGLLAALLNFALLRGGDETIPVLTAVRDVQPGERLTPDLLGTSAVDVDAPIVDRLFPAEAAADLDGRVATSRIGAGDPILRTALAPPGHGADGLRAMSLPVDPAHAVGGLLRVGDRVDVIEVLDDGARYVATGLEVLAVADGTSGGALGGLGSYSVTVAVDDGTALRLAAAIRGDRFELVRSTGAASPDRADADVGTAAGDPAGEPGGT